MALVSTTAGNEPRDDLFRTLLPAELAALRQRQLDRQGAVAQVLRLLTETLADVAVYLDHDAPAAPLRTAFTDPALRARWERVPLTASDPLTNTLRSDLPCVITNTVTDQRLDRRWVRASGLRSWLSVPLRGADGRLGALGFARCAGGRFRPFAETDLPLIEQVALDIARTLESAPLPPGAPTSTGALNALAAITMHFRALSSESGDLARWLNDLLVLLGQWPADSALIFLGEADGAGLRLAACYDHDPDEEAQRRAALTADPPRSGEGPLGAVAAGAASFLIADAERDGGDLPQSPATVGLHSWLCVPLRLGKAGYGILTLGRRESGQPFDERDLTLVEGIAGQLALVLTNLTLQERLAETTASFQELVEQSLDPFFVLSLDGRLLVVNESFCTTTGYQAGQLRGMHLVELLVPEERELGLARLAAVFGAGPRGGVEEWTLVRANGERCILELRARVMTEQGQLAGVQCIARDITIRREQQRALERQVRDLTTLHLAGLAMAGTLDMAAIQQGLVDALCAAISCDDATLYTIEKDVMHLGATAPDPQSPPLTFPQGHELIDWSLQHGQSLLFNDAPSDPNTFPSATSTEPRHLLIAPLLSGGQVRGYFVLRRRTGEPFTADELRLVESLAAPAAVTLHNALLHAETSFATTDLRAVLENIRQGVLVTDRAGRIRYANRQVGELLTLDTQTLIGWRLVEVAEQLIAPRMRDPNRLVERQRWLDTNPGEASTDELTLLRPVVRVLEHYSGPVHDPDSGEMSGRIIVYTDVTDARQLERAKEEFLATASHELKTPLTTLGGYVELLDRQVNRPEGADVNRLRRYVATARGELQRLRRLSEDLLEVARIQAGRLALHLEQGDLASTIRDTVERFSRRPGLRERGHRLVCEIVDSLPARYDPLRLTQVVNNLIENALKYSPNGGQIVIAMTREGDDAVLTVRDWGIGVPDEDRERLFLPFFRAANASAGSAEGLGLGLYISRGIVEGHGGSLVMEPAPDHGSLFRVVLPLGDGENGGA